MAAQRGWRRRALVPCFLPLCAAAATGDVVSGGLDACLKELTDIAASPTLNFSLWNASHRVANPEWNGQEPVLPGFIAFPRTAADVARCLQCATRNGLRVSVKGGGHSFGGYGTLPASQGFMISMQNMSSAAPVVEGAPGEPATVVAQAGARWQDVYQSFKRSGKEWVVNGGLCPTVGVASFTMGGGVGPAARLHGMGVDGVQSFTMVTATGDRVVVANKTSNPDLFWALRGGGGGNFGVLTELTLAVHPGPDLYTIGELCFPWEATTRLLEAVQKYGPSIRRTVNVDMVVDKTPADSGACLWITAIETLKTTREVVAPIVQAVLPSKPGKDTLRESDCWWEGIVSFGEEHGYSEFSDSPYYSKNCLLDEITPELVATLVNLTQVRPDSCDGQHFIGFGGKANEVRPEDTAFFWRNTSYMVYTSCGYDTADADSRKAAVSWLDQWTSKVFPFCNGGSYVNFIDPLAGSHGPERYYGGNLPRLQEIKRRWNPSGSSPLHFPLEIPTTGATWATIAV